LQAAYEDSPGFAFWIDRHDGREVCVDEGAEGVDDQKEITDPSLLGCACWRANDDKKITCGRKVAQYR
jgi:hypothetical protein